MFGIIYKIVHSLGSDKLIEIVNKVCDEVDTPASLLVKHGILMAYTNNLQIKELTKRMNEKNFSEIANKAIKLMVVNHYSLHTLRYQDRQRIENELKIHTKRFLPKS